MHPCFYTTECGAEEQIVDHVVPQCPIHRPLHGAYGLTILDDGTNEPLLTPAPISSAAEQCKYKRFVWDTNSVLLYCGLQLVKKSWPIFSDQLKNFGEILKDRVVQPAKIATFLAYESYHFCMIRNDCHRESGVFKQVKTFGVPLYDFPPNAWSGSATVSLTRKPVRLFLRWCINNHKDCGFSEPDVRLFCLV